MLIPLAMWTSLAIGAPSWPACSVKTLGNGGPAVVIDGKERPPLFFTANNQFGRDEVNYEEIRGAHEAGINIIGFMLRLDWIMSSQEAAGIVDRFCAVNPEAYFYVQVWLGPSGGWLEEHPDEAIADATGTRLHFASPASRIWREEAGIQLRARIEEITSGPHADRFIGVELQYLNTAEWFYPQTNDFLDYSKANLERFRAWVKTRYGSDGALRKAWGNGNVTLATLAIPSPEERMAASWGPFRHPVEHRASIDFTQYQNTLVPEAIAYFARIVKDATQGRSLVGAFYGYTLEMHGNGPAAFLHSGHLALENVLANKDLDIVRAPYSYLGRAVGKPGHLHSPGDSFALHGKLGLYDDDTYTHLGFEKPADGLMAPGWPDRTKNIEETLAVNRRNFSLFMGHGCGLGYYDLLSDGRWNHPAVWVAAAQLRRIAEDVKTAAPFTPEVAVVVDEKSPCVMRDDTWPYLFQSLYYWRTELDQIGAPVGYFLQSDLPKLPDSVKVAVLTNAYMLSAEERQAAVALRDRGATLVWTYAPDVFGPQGADPKRIADVTGIHVRPVFDGLYLRLDFGDLGGVVDVDQRKWIDETWLPRFVAADPDARVLGRYTESGEVCAAEKKCGQGTNVYTAFPRLPRALLRALCRQAGVHLYRDTPGMTAVVGDCLIVHTAEAGAHPFRWPAKCTRVERLAPAPEETVSLDTDHWADKLPGGVTAIYRCLN